MKIQRTWWPMSADGWAHGYAIRTPHFFHRVPSLDSQCEHTNVIRIGRTEGTYAIRRHISSGSKKYRYNGKGYVVQWRKLGAGLQRYQRAKLGQWPLVGMWWMRGDWGKTVVGLTERRKRRLYGKTGSSEAPESDIRTVRAVH